MKNIYDNYFSSIFLQFRYAKNPRSSPEGCFECEKCERKWSKGGSRKFELCMVFLALIILICAVYEEMVARVIRTISELPKKEGNLNTSQRPYLFR